MLSWVAFREVLEESSAPIQSQRGHCEAWEVCSLQWSLVAGSLASGPCNMKSALGRGHDVFWDTTGFVKQKPKALAGDRLADTSKLYNYFDRP